MKATLVTMLPHVYYLTGILGVGASIWGFKKSRKAAYMVFGLYFLQPFAYALVSCFYRPDARFHAKPEEVQAPAQDVADQAKDAKQAIPLPTRVRVIHRVIHLDMVIPLVAIWLLAWKEKKTETSEPVVPLDGVATRLRQ
ncbi:MAG TPA: hypothetical protein VNA25_13265 [Phycisphaerae bacterium]|nr:hypothetical protein [Phycisphaerae bacterium]